MKDAVRMLTVAVLLGTAVVGRAAEFTDQRVFTHSEQRQRLDRARESMRIKAPDRSARRVIEVEQPPELPEVRLQGYIQRSDGPPAVWLNDGNTLDSERTDEGVQVYSGRIRDRAVLLRLPDGRYLRLKPGQRYDPDSGRVIDDVRE